MGRNFKPQGSQNHNETSPGVGGAFVSCVCPNFLQTPPFVICVLIFSLGEIPVLSVELYLSSSLQDLSLSFPLSFPNSFPSLLPSFSLFFFFFFNSAGDQVQGPIHVKQVLYP